MDVIFGYPTISQFYRKTEKVVIYFPLVDCISLDMILLLEIA